MQSRRTYSRFLAVIWCLLSGTSEEYADTSVFTPAASEKLPAGITQFHRVPGKQISVSPDWFVGLCSEKMKRVWCSVEKSLSEECVWSSEPQVPQSSYCVNVSCLVSAHTPHTQTHKYLESCKSILQGNVYSTIKFQIAWTVIGQNFDRMFALPLGSALPPSLPLQEGPVVPSHTHKQNTPSEVPLSLLSLRLPAQPHPASPTCKAHKTERH